MNGIILMIIGLNYEHDSYGVFNVINITRFKILKAPPSGGHYSTYTVASSRVSRVSINLWINTAISKGSSANIAMYSSESNFPVPLARLYDHPNRHEIAMLPIKITTASMRTHVYLHGV